MTEPVIVKKKDKKVVEDEHRTDEQVRELLHVLPPAGFDADFHALHNAYKCLKPDEFEVFVVSFKEWVEIWQQKASSVKRSWI
jgi:hypothetical protein